MSFFAEFILSGNELLRLRLRMTKEELRMPPLVTLNRGPERSEGAGDSSVAEFTLSEAEVLPQNDK